jgi:hypothetical protein
MSDTGDFMRAFEACFDAAEYAAAHRLAHEFWGRLLHRCVWCGTKSAESLKKGCPLRLGPMNDRLTFRFCDRCYPKARKIVKTNDEMRLAVDWEMRVYGMGLTYRPKRPMTFYQGMTKRRVK